MCQTHWFTGKKKSCDDHSKDQAYLITGTLEHKVALLDEVKGEFEVQVGTLAQGLQVGAELAEGRVVHLAVERNVVLDLRAAVDAVQDVALQVLVYGVVLLQAVQGDAVKRQRVGDLLRNATASKRINFLNFYRLLGESCVKADGPFHSLVQKGVGSLPVTWF